MGVGGVSVTVDGTAATITFWRPPENVLDRETINAIEARLREVARRRDVRLVTLAARGEDFCNGTEILAPDGGQAEALFAAWHSLIRFLLTCEVPTCALVQGRALGAGAELALACDFVFAETTATFGFPEIHRGSFPPVAAVLLERRTGRTKAADLILCGAAMTAEAAERRGLVNALVNPGDLIEALETMRASPRDPFGLVPSSRQAGPEPGQLRRRPFRPLRRRADLDSRAAPDRRRHRGDPRGSRRPAARLEGPLERGNPAAGEGSPGRGGGGRRRREGARRLRGQGKEKETGLTLRPGVSGAAADLTREAAG